MFICLEGVDASGKATQSKLLVQRLPNCKLFSFPDYSTPVGKLILAHLKNEVALDTQGMMPTIDSYEVGKADALAFQCMQLANRMEHAVEISEHLYAHNGNVVADRYWPSGVVFGVADGLDNEYMHKLHQFLPQPDIFILVDIDLDHSIARRPERRDRYEKDHGLMEMVIAGYRALWRQHENDDTPWIIVDGRESVDEVHGNILEAMGKKP
jgi:dTMP kinase